MERFCTRLPESLDETQCWNWRGALDRHGYGRIREGGNTGVSHLAHRIAWELHHSEPVPPGMCVCHSCDNRACVNPLHLFLGTPTDNNLDRSSKERSSRGSQHHKSKLTADQVLRIRQSFEQGLATKTELANQFGVSDTSIHLIITGRNWRHLT